jgi:hypothetical protein
LNGQTVTTKNANLSATADIVSAATLKQNENLGFIGTRRGGPFKCQISTDRRTRRKSPANQDAAPESRMKLADHGTEPARRDDTRHGLEKLRAAVGKIPSRRRI